MKAESRTLPIRGWYVLALAALFFIPVLITAIVATTQVQGPWNNVPKAAQMLRDGASRWNEPAWQEATRSRLAPQGVDFVLFENGHEVYRSTAKPLAGTDGDHQRLVQRLVVGGS